MDLEKMIEEIKEDKRARKRILRFFGDHIDDWVISFLLSNNLLLTNDAYLFLFDHALTDLAKRNLRRAGKNCTREHTEKEKRDLILFARNATKVRKNEAEPLAPCVKWLFYLLCDYERHLKGK